MSPYMHALQSPVTSLQLSEYIHARQSGMGTHAGKHLAQAIRCLETDLRHHGDADVLATESRRENSLKWLMIGFAEM